MLSVDEALQRILQRTEPLEAETVDVDRALGRVLAEPVVSRQNSPPFDKALMDGYAIRAADIVAPVTRLTCIESLTAGQTATRAVGPGEACRIMTGTPMPPGADSVVPVEQTAFDDVTSQVEVTLESLQPGANVMLTGTSFRTGEHLMEAGHRLSAESLGLLAELGYGRTRVRRCPRVAILATGDELVEPTEVPGPGQIRNSNATMLVAQCQRAGVIPVPLGIARDERQDLQSRIRAGLEHDVLILSGGVSAGVLDLVPSELAAAGVQQEFHKVHLKPGKPIWFGVRAADPSAGAAARSLVFGLPGNPVSSLVCFELFVRPALRALQASPHPRGATVAARLTEEHIARGGRPTYYPGRLHWDASGARVTLSRWRGSADLRSTVDANAMIVLGAEPRTYAAGDTVDVIPWEFEPTADAGGELDAPPA